MDKTRKHFTQDYLVGKVKAEIERRLCAEGDECDKVTKVVDAAMSCLAMFTFKYPSLLKFDGLRSADKTARLNIKRLFGVTKVPCDTHMRTVLDKVSPGVIGPAFKVLFALLQRANLLNHYLFLDK